MASNSVGVSFTQQRETMSNWKLVATDGSVLDKNSALILADQSDFKKAQIKILFKNLDVTESLTGGRGLRSWMIPAVIPVLDSLSYEQAREMIMALVLRKRSRGGSTTVTNSSTVTASFHASSTGEIATHGNSSSHRPSSSSRRSRLTSISSVATITTTTSMLETFLRDVDAVQPTPGPSNSAGPCCYINPAFDMEDSFRLQTPASPSVHSASNLEQENEDRVCSLGWLCGVVWGCVNFFCGNDGAAAIIEPSESPNPQIMTLCRSETPLYDGLERAYTLAKLEEADIMQAALQVLVVASFPRARNILFKYPLVVSKLKLASNVIPTRPEELAPLVAHCFRRRGLAFDLEEVYRDFRHTYGVLELTTNGERKIMY